MEPNLRNVVFTIQPNAGLLDGERNGRRITVQGGKRFDIREGEHLDFKYQRADDRWRSRDDPGERSGWVAKSINSQGDLWTPPLDRESKLEVVKSGPLYDIRVYRTEKRPSRLYDNEEEDELQQYRIPPGSFSPEKAKALEAERQEVIRSQAVRRSTTVAERLSPKDRSTEGTTALSKEAAETTRSYSTGFAVCFDGYSPSQGSTAVDPKNIDTEQISFAAARQQFLELEKSNPNILLGGGQQAGSPNRAPMAPRSVSGRGGHQTSVILKEIERLDPSDQRGWGGLNEKTNLPTAQRHRSVSYDQVMLAQDSARRNLTSSSSGKTHPGLEVVITDEWVSQKNMGNPLDSVARGPSPAEGLEAEPETPIEREIRLSLEREEDLWKQRGIPRTRSRDELVEIRAKPLLFSSVSSPASSTKGKEKPRVSFPVQREIEQETKREEDLQREGRLPGTYSRGACPQLTERRKVFEQEKEMTALSPGRAKKSGEGGSSLGLGNLAMHADDGDGIPSQDVKRTFEVYQPSAAQDGRERDPRGELFSFSQNSATFNHQMDSPRPKFPSVLNSEDPGDTLVIQKEHFAIPVRKFRFSFSDDREPSSTQRDEDGPRRAAARNELYTLKTWRPRTSALIDQDIQDTLQRELELQEERRTAGLAVQMGPGSPQPSRNSASTGVAVSSPVSSASISAPSSALPESNFRTFLSPPMRRREEGKYAGIELSDEIDTEVVRSTKAICRRGVLAQRWESGEIYQTRSDDENDNGD